MLDRNDLHHYQIVRAPTFPRYQEELPGFVGGPQNAGPQPLALGLGPRSIAPLLELAKLPKARVEVYDLPRFPPESCHVT